MKCITTLYGKLVPGCWSCTVGTWHQENKVVQWQITCRKLQTDILKSNIISMVFQLRDSLSEWGSRCRLIFFEKLPWKANAVVVQILWLLCYEAVAVWRPSAFQMIVHQGTSLPWNLVLLLYVGIPQKEIINMNTTGSLVINRPNNWEGI